MGIIDQMIPWLPWWFSIHEFVRSVRAVYSCVLEEIGLSLEPFRAVFALISQNPRVYLFMFLHEMTRGESLPADLALEGVDLIVSPQVDLQSGRVLVSLPTLITDVAPHVRVSREMPGQNSLRQTPQPTLPTLVFRKSLVVDVLVRLQVPTRSEPQPTHVANQLLLVVDLHVPNQVRRTRRILVANQTTERDVALPVLTLVLSQLTLRVEGQLTETAPELELLVLGVVTLHVDNNTFLSCEASTTRWTGVLRTFRVVMLTVPTPTVAGGKLHLTLVTVVRSQVAWNVHKLTRDYSNLGNNSVIVIHIQKVTLPVPSCFFLM
jgi:hypothetical protein